MRLDKEAAAGMQKQSTQFLNFMARNYADFLCKVMVKILHTAIKGGASPALMKIKDDYKTVAPQGLKPFELFVLDVDIGVNEAAEKLNKAVGIMQAVGMLQGQPDPQTGQVIGVQAELLPTAGYEIGKLILEAHGAKDLVDSIFLKPDTVEDPQVQAAIKKAVGEIEAQHQQQMAQMQQQITEQVKLELQTAQKQAEVELKAREMDLKERDQDFKEDEAAFKVATGDVAEERREDADATKLAIADNQNDTARHKIDTDAELKREELELLKKQAAESEEKKTTGVVSP